MPKKSLNNEIAKEFRKYCSKCKGLCCSKEINAFTFEIKKWPKAKLSIKKNWQKSKPLRSLSIRRFNIGKRCPFLQHDHCQMSPNIRPIDCLSYPIYPSIDDLKKENNFISELVVHKSCPFATEISKNLKIKKLLFEFWNKKLKKIGKKAISIWLGEKRNYWLDKNIIKIKDVQRVNKH